MNNNVASQQRQVWGRRQSRPLKEKQQQALSNLWPHLCLTLSEQEMLSPLTLFSVPVQETWLEIGFGGGEHLAAQAATHSRTGFIGCEPFINGVASLAVHVQQKSLVNVKILQDDARLLLAKLPDNSISRIFVLFPDPWPKKRHHKRRIIQPGTVEEFFRVLSPDGKLYMATDHTGYAEWIKNIMDQSTRFTLENGKNTSRQPNGWHPTRYELKALAAGHAPEYMIYIKRHFAGQDMIN